tara:strand:+ start:61 stop:363 length:303 start_codon:yes stop_codon:yes gene_type:complete
MEFKGTKGEWIIAKRSTVVVMCGERSVANTGGFQDSNEIETQNENEANAKLIAAAPLLLAELISIMESCKGNAKHSIGLNNKAYTEIYQSAEKAIEKALK